MRVPRRWLLVALLSLSLSLSLPRPGRAGRCQPGELRQLWGGHTKCCPPCPWKGEDPWPCEAIQDHECRCPPGSGCGDESCLSCRRLPRCEPGWEPHRIGIIDFHFECRRCGNGSYSGRNGWCRNWTDCESSGFITLRAGNSTHNAVCGLPGRAPQPGTGEPRNSLLCLRISQGEFPSESRENSLPDPGKFPSKSRENSLPNPGKIPFSTSKSQGKFPSKSRENSLFHH
uniref:TNFR-Cys domain-containing protein n=1 Tax=Cyanoderma ruficeps TaxID=181631 RepID=A0A8C3NWK6_9PASS